MKNWLLYFFAVLTALATLPLAAKLPDSSVGVPVISVFTEGAVTEMTLEEYTLRAMLAEGKSATEQETKKALAVSIRSEGLYLSAFGLKHKDFDVCDSASCCLPLGDLDKAEKSFLEECVTAVSETEGFVLMTEEGMPVLALFCLCSGSGTTPCQEFPYLSAVAEPKKCEIHITEKSVPTAELGIVAREDSCGVYDRYGKFDLAVLSGKIYEGDELQKLLELPSAEFEFEINGEYVNAKSVGAGQAHGLNICGGNRLSEAGKSFQDILAHYYPKLKLNKIYNN